MMPAWRRLCAAALCAVLALAAAGCATLPDDALPRDAVRAATVELDTVPFFPQRRFQCGPAALATVLNWSGSSVQPDALAPLVYLPERQGSLQIELIAAARRHSRVPYTLPPRLAALLQEIEAGHPVLVLQNLGVRWLPRWHYAVAVGYDLGTGTILLRSGEERRHTLPLATFLHTWRRGGYWALVTLPPERLPRTAEELTVLRALAAFETTGDRSAAQHGYAAAVARWPQSLAAWMALGNNLYQSGDFTAAIDAYRHTLSLQSDYAPALNNLAQSLAEMGSLEEAETYAAEAAAQGGTHAAVYSETLRAIRQRLRGSAP